MPRVQFSPDFHLHFLKHHPLDAIVSCLPHFVSPGGARRKGKRGEKHMSLAYKYEERGLEYGHTISPKDESFLSKEMRLLGRLRNKRVCVRESCISMDSCFSIRVK
jgi:hypothetical protein